MNKKQSTVKKLASLYGLKLEYFDSLGNFHKVNYNDCLNFLSSINVNIDEIENLEEYVLELEHKDWNRWVPPVQVVRKPELPIINLRVSKDEINKTFEWVLIEEGGQVHQGHFAVSSLTVNMYKQFKKRGTYFQIELPLPVKPDAGYHTLIIKHSSLKESSMKLIIAPEKCYIPEWLSGSKTIRGPRITFRAKSDKNISDFGYLNYVLRALSKEKSDIVGIGHITQPYIPVFKKGIYYNSSTRLFNTFYLNVDNMISYIDNEALQPLFRSNEFQELLKELSESDSSSYEEIYRIKYQIYRIIYQGFRDHHIKTNSPKCQDYYYFTSKKRNNLRKLCLFEALEDYFCNEETSIQSWHNWPEAYQNPNSDVVKAFEKDNLELIQFYEFLQWQVDIQLAEAGYISYEKDLSIGICSDLDLSIDPDGAEAWLNQDYFNHNVYISEPDLNTKELPEDFKGKPPLIPGKLYENGYSYFIELLWPNMLHSGALKIDNLSNLYSLKWISNDDVNTYEYHINYPFEDLLGILALESHRHKCMIVTDDYDTIAPKAKQAIIKYGILTQSSFQLKEIIDDSELVSLYGIIQKEADASLNAEGNDQLSITEHKTDIPVSTYRLQFNKNFTFKQAKEIIPYLKSLGITHCYASPILKARPNSMHGYDIINHNKLNPSLGRKEDFYDFVNTLHHYGMGLIVDIVPNHMGIGQNNKWWMDVLENGPSSEYASYFDIDWKPLKKELYGKVLVPILGSHYGNILSNGELSVKFTPEDGKLTLHYYEHKFPINPSSYPTILEYRIDVLESRLGSYNNDLLEYQSIITEFINLPLHTETSYEKIKERRREKDIAFRRLSTLCENNKVIKEFILENLQYFKSRSDDPFSITRMHNLLEEQAYRLAYWRVSSDEINYRRFFDVNELACLNMNERTVFTNTHGLILDLVEEKMIDGLRIDHPDGLFNPTQYFLDLQKEICKRLDIIFDDKEEKLCGSDRLPFYVISEKILAPFEKLPESWAVHGTVGYEFLNSVTDLFTDLNNEKKFEKTYHKFLTKEIDFQELVIEGKKLIMKTSLNGELNVLSNLLNKISENYYLTRDYTLNSIRDSLVEIISCFPVYRTYISEGDISNKDLDYIKWAVGYAKSRSQSVDISIFDFIEKVLINEFEEDEESPMRAEILKFLMKFQQYTGPLMAKGLEDTSFYRYNRLISLNEVGGEPQHFGINVNDFHNQNLNRLNFCPHNMLTTSTHDTKRSEDVRARLSVLSEIPEEWQKQVNRWAQLFKSRKVKTEKGLYPSKNDEYLFYQTLIGIWPLEKIDDHELNTLIQRLEEYMLKAIREAKVHTSWVNTNIQYEETLGTFIRKVLTSYDKHPFWKDFLPFQEQIALRGFTNSLAQSVLKFTCPGMPDIYQGNELFKFTLVDPDNRRPVNYNTYKGALKDLAPLLHHNPDEGCIDKQLIDSKIYPLKTGACKLYVTSSILNFRRAEPDLFKYGEYIPLETTGAYAEKIIAFCRKHNENTAFIVVPRLTYNLIDNENKLPLTGEIWKDTAIIVPEELQTEGYLNLFDHTTHELYENKLYAGNLFNALPVAVLSAKKRLPPDETEGN